MMCNPGILDLPNFPPNWYQVPSAVLFNAASLDRQAKAEEREKEKERDTTKRRWKRRLRPVHRWEQIVEIRRCPRSRFSDAYSKKSLIWPPVFLELIHAFVYLHVKICKINVHMCLLSHLLLLY
jgi:hypothetical protein